LLIAIAIVAFICSSEKDDPLNEVKQFLRVHEQIKANKTRQKRAEKEKRAFLFIASVGLKIAKQ